MPTTQEANPRDGIISQIEIDRARTILANNASTSTQDDHYLRNLAVACVARLILARQEIPQSSYNQILATANYAAFPPHSKALSAEIIERAAEVVADRSSRGEDYTSIAITAIAQTEERYPTDEQPWRKSIATGTQAAEHYFQNSSPYSNSYPEKQGYPPNYPTRGYYTEDYPTSLPPPPAYSYAHQTRMPNGKEILTEVIGPHAFSSVGSYYNAPELYNTWYRTAVTCKAAEIMAEQFRSTGDTHSLPLKNRPSSQALEAAAYEVSRWQGLDALRRSAISSIEKTNKLLPGANPYEWSGFIRSGESSLRKTGYQYQPGTRDQIQYEREVERDYNRYHIDQYRFENRFFGNHGPRIELRGVIPPGISVLEWRTKKHR